MEVVVGLYGPPGPTAGGISFVIDRASSSATGVLNEDMINKGQQQQQQLQIKKKNQKNEQDEVKLKNSMAGVSCFNCDGFGHGVTKCPFIINSFIVNERKQKFTRLNKLKKSRYFMIEDVEEMSSSRDSTPVSSAQLLFPDVTLSQETRKAMGLAQNQLPPFIYRMRTLGYPPAYRQKCLEISQPLILHLPKGPNDDAQWALEEESWTHEVEVTINPDYIIHFEGFNAPPGPDKIDESHIFYSPTYSAVEHLHSKKAFIEDATIELKNWVHNVRVHRQYLQRNTRPTTGRGPGGIKRHWNDTHEDQQLLNTTSTMIMMDNDGKKQMKFSVDKNMENLISSKSNSNFTELFNFSKNYPETFAASCTTTDDDDENDDDNKIKVNDSKCAAFNNKNSQDNKTNLFDNDNGDDDDDGSGSGDWTKIQKVKKPSLESFTTGIDLELLLPDVMEPTGRLSRILNQIKLFKNQPSSSAT